MKFFRRVLSPVGATLLVATLASAQCGLEPAAGDPIAQLQGDVDAVTTWDPDGAGPQPQCLVAAGAVRVGDAVLRHVVLWNGSAWVGIDEPFAQPPYPGSIVTPAPPLLTTWNGKLIVHYRGDIWSFDGSTWALLGSPKRVFNTFGAVGAMVVYNGELVVAGNFVVVDAPAQPLVYATNIARWNGATWSPLGTGLVAPALTVGGTCAAVFNNALWVGASYQSVFPVPSITGGMHVWNGTAWTTVGTWDGPIYTVAPRIGTALTNSFLFVGGAFNSVGGAVSPNVVRFSPSTNSWSAVGPPPTAGAVSTCQQLFVRSIGISSYELAGVFSTTGTDKAWTWSGSAWTALPALADAEPITSARLAYHGGRYVVGVRCVPATASRGLRAHDAAAGAWQPLLGAGIGGVVRAVCHDGQQLVIGGDFTAISGSVVNHIARGTANAWQPLGSGFAAPVRAIARLPNGDLVAGGDFTTLGDGTPMLHLARWNGATWNAIGGGVGGDVHTLAVAPNGDLLVGGAFTLAGAVPANRVARWNGGSWSPLGTGCDAAVHAILQLGNGDLVAGGAFTVAGGLPANHLARFGGGGWSAIGAGVDGDVYALTESNDGIVAGGAFQFSGVYPVGHLARWDGTGATWYPFGTFDQPDHAIHALATLPGGETAIGGVRFTVSGGAPTCAAIWRNGAWQSLDVDGASVLSLAMHGDGALALGGEFGLVEGAASGNVARLVSSCPASVALAAPGCPSSGGTSTLAAVTLPWVNGTFRSRALGVPANAFVLVLTSPSFLTPGVPLSLLLPQGVPGCEVRVAPDILQLVPAVAGAAETGLFLPDSPPLVGIWFYQQMLPFEIDAQGAWIAITATNTIEVTPGAF